MTIVNSYGAAINYEAAVNLMDDELCEQLSGEIAPCTEQAFFDAYCAAHLAKYGEPWELDKSNPTY